MVFMVSMVESDLIFHTQFVILQFNFIRNKKKKTKFRFFCTLQTFFAIISIECVWTVCKSIKQHEQNKTKRKSGNL